MTGQNSKKNEPLNIVLQTLVLIALLLCIIGPLKVESKKPIQVGVSENTPVPIIAEWPIGPDTQVGEHFSAKIVDDIVSDSGEIFIPKGSRVTGTVLAIEPAKSFNRGGKVDINFEKIIFPDNITSINILADGSLEKDPSKNAKFAGQALGKTTAGALLGALAGFKFGGIVGSGTSTASNIAIGAMTGASLSLISFIAKKGDEVEIFPGLPMILNIMDMESQNYKAQQLLNEESSAEVQAHILKQDYNKISVSIENNLRRAIPLSNLKIVDGLGYTVRPNIPFNYHDLKNIPAKTSATYDFEFNPTSKEGRYWLVLTDSFNKQVYFKKEIAVK
jgi:hypothetical protein